MVKLINSNYYNKKLHFASQMLNNWHLLQFLPEWLVPILSFVQKPETENNQIELESLFKPEGNDLVKIHDLVKILYSFVN